MKKSGIAILPLHEGTVPPKLIAYMTRLSSEIVELIVSEYGTSEFLRRISDPFWFQALGCVLGFDWHSSGLTTVVTGVLRSAIKPEVGLAAFGGKGALSRRVPDELGSLEKIFSMSEGKIGELRYASRMTAKVDNAAIQDGYQLYHHVIFVAKDGSWAVVQQGMDVATKTARRYHWISEGLRSFVEEPHCGIVGDLRKDVALDMTAKRSSEARRTSVDLVKEGPRRLIRDLREISRGPLDRWVGGNVSKKAYVDVLYLPRRINWNAIRRAYELQPRNYEELLSIQGVGPAAIRALALVSEIVYGHPVSWRDPIKYTFAHGGKDGVPYPVDYDTYLKTIKILADAIREAKLGREEKLAALRRLSSAVADFKKAIK